jgi:glycosyltransferase involved in cell wall biosynthesis
MKISPPRGLLLIHGRISTNNASADWRPRLKKHMSKIPLVSVIIPTYNAAKFIRETLDSVFAQTFEDYEVIVINDGSLDTEELERALEPYLNRIVYLKQEKRGVASARNTGILRAQGAFLAFLDSDDMWLPEFLSEAVKCFQNAPSLDLVYTDTFFFHDTPPVGTLVMKPSLQQEPVTFDNLLTRRCQVVMSCTVVRKRIVVDSGLFDERLRRVEDYDLWLRVAFRGGKMARHQKTLGLHRIHTASLSADGQRMIEDWTCVLTRFRDNVDLPAQVRELLEKTVQEAQAELELIKGKQYVLHFQTQLARAPLERAYEFSRAKKLRMLLWGLRMVPWLITPLVKGQHLFMEGIDLVRAMKESRLHWVPNRRRLYRVHFGNAAS